MRIRKSLVVPAAAAALSAGLITAGAGPAAAWTVPVPGTGGCLSPFPPCSGSFPWGR